MSSVMALDYNGSTDFGGVFKLYGPKKLAISRVGSDAASTSRSAGATPGCLPI
jgi:hypothetical protein